MEWTRDRKEEKEELKPRREEVKKETRASMYEN